MRGAPGGLDERPPVLRALRRQRREEAAQQVRPGLERVRAERGADDALAEDRVRGAQASPEVLRRRGGVGHRAEILKRP